MKLLITGACGALGTALVQKIIKEHPTYELICVDRAYQILDNPHKEIFNHKNITIESTDCISVYRLLLLHSPKILIHCAEHNLITSSLNTPDIIDTNIQQTYKVLYYCASKNIRVVIPTWKSVIDSVSSFKGKNFIIYSLYQRQFLSQFFNRGNVVISRIFLPNFISKYNYENIYCAFLNRLYQIYLDPSLPFTFNTTENLLEIKTWCTIDEAVQLIIESMHRRTREDFTLNGYIYTGTDMIVMGMKAFHLDHIQLGSDSQTENDHIYKFIHSNQDLWTDQKKIIKLIQSEFNVYEKTNG